MFLLWGSGSSPGSPPAIQAAEVSLLNVSYDVTREFYREFNILFAAHWKEKTGEALSINQSNGGSS